MLFLDENIADISFVYVPNDFFLLFVVKHWNLIVFSDFFNFWWIGLWYQSEKPTSVVYFCIFGIYIIHHFIFTKATVQFGKFLFKNKADRNLPRPTFLYFYRKEWILCTWQGLLCIQNNVFFALIRFFSYGRWFLILPWIMSIKTRFDIIAVDLEDQLIAMFCHRLKAVTITGELIHC